MMIKFRPWLQHIMKIQKTPRWKRQKFRMSMSLCYWNAYPQRFFLRSMIFELLGNGAIVPLVNTASIVIIGSPDLWKQEALSCCTSRTHWLMGGWGIGCWPLQKYWLHKAMRNKNESTMEGVKIAPNSLRMVTFETCW